jgi:protein-S-isoprenylcysteine O-methyltransferase Ste14
VSAARRIGGRLDPGKLVMVPVAAGLLLLDLSALARSGGLRGAGLLGAAPACAFYVLVIWCYLRRGRPVATSRCASAHLAAVSATVAPFAFPLLTGPAVLSRQWAGGALVAVGVGWSLWALWSLGRSVSVIAQARALVDRGPYRWVRHPLYTGEILSSLGLAITVWSPAALALWAGLCVLQVYRAVREEQLLLRALPGYRGYRDRTAALLPGVF